MTTTMRPLTKTETDAYLAGQLAFEGAVETEHGVEVPATYEDMVRAIGRGFHPDTSGDQYVTLPEGWTPELVDAVLDEAFASKGASPFDRALWVLFGSDD